MTILFKTPQPDALLLSVLLAISLVISVSYLSYYLVTKCCTRGRSPNSALPLPGVACRHLKPSQLPSSSVKTSNTMSKSDVLSRHMDESSERSLLLERTATTSTQSVISLSNNTPNNQLYSFAFTPNNTLSMGSSFDDCRYAENISTYGTTNPEHPNHTVVAVGVNVPRDAATAHSKREDLGGYDGSVKFGGSVWSTTSSIGVNENRLYDHFLRSPEDWREDLKKRKDEWEARNRLLAQYAKQ